MQRILWGNCQNCESDKKKKYKIKSSNNYVLDLVNVIIDFQIFPPPRICVAS